MFIRHPLTPVLVAFAAAPLLFASTALGQVSLDFETGDQFNNQFTNNFRPFYGANLVNQTGPADGADFLRISAQASNNASTIVYHAGYSSGAEQSLFSVTQFTPVTISADVSFSNTNSSFGIYIIDSSNEANGYLALFNIDAANTADRIRFFSGSTPTNGGAGTSQSQTDGEAFSLGGFGKISVTYSIDANNQPVLSLAAVSFSQSYVFAGGTAFTNVEIGFRLSAQGGTGSTVDVDNIQISQVPEPSVFGLLSGTGALAVGFCRSRRQTV